MKLTIHISIGSLLLISSMAFAQINKAKSLQVGNTSTNSMNSSAALQIDDTTRGFLGARMTTAQRTAIASPARGLQVYDTDTNSLWLFNGTVWVDGASSALAWAKSGNGGTNSATDFIGTIDSTDVHFRTKNISRMKIDAAGNVGIGITATTPLDSSYKLDVKGTLNSKMVQIHNDPPTSTDIFLQSGTWEGCYISTLNSGMTIKNNCNFGNMSFQLNGYAPGGFSFTGGNVGIGTTSPTQALDVTGNMKFSGALMPNNTAGTAGQVLTSAGAGAVPTWTTLPTTNLYTSNGSLSGNRIVTQGANTLAFTSTATNGFSVDGSTFSVDALNHRIGIGTATPAAALDVAGTAKFNGGATISSFLGGTWIDMPTTGASAIGSGGAGVNPWVAYVSGTGYWFGNATIGDMAYRNTTGKLLFGNTTGNASMALSGDKLGIGTITPTEKLDIIGNMKFSGALMPNNTAGTAGQVLTSAGSGAAPTWTSLPASSVTLYGSDGSLSGNRTVSQGTNTLAFTSTATTGTSQFTVDGTTLNVNTVNNRIGIGTATPAYTLDVLGTVNATSNITSSGYIQASGSVYAGGLFRGTSGMYFSNPGGQGIALRDGTWQGANITYSTNSLSFSENDNSGSMNFILGGSVGTKSFNFTGGNLGIGTTTPTVKLEVSGAIKVGTENITTPTAGMIRFNSTNNTFEGYNGTAWISF